MYEYLGFCPEGVGASGGYDGCDGLRSGPEISDLDSPGVPWTLVLLPVPGSSRASSLPHKPHSASISQVLRCMSIWASARRAWGLQEVTTAAKRP
ncbi:hypothetical protein B0B36_14815 [Pseudomonas syringae pv. actinidifoliorum]|nr:hypothetical protein B0B36_14815 [Pseudomonas syringae pv. actinidifoliorum]